MNHELSWLVKSWDSSKWFIEIILGLVESHPSKSLYTLNMFCHWSLKVLCFLSGRSREHSYQKHATVGLHHWLETREGCDRREGGVFVDERLMADCPYQLKSSYKVELQPWSYSFIRPFTNNQFLRFCLVGDVLRIPSHGRSSWKTRHLG